MLRRRKKKKKKIFFFLFLKAATLLTDRVGVELCINFKEFQPKNQQIRSNKMIHRLEEKKLKIKS